MIVYIVVEEVLTQNGVVHNLISIHSDKQAAEKFCMKITKDFMGNRKFMVDERRVGE